MSTFVVFFNGTRHGSFSVSLSIFVVQCLTAPALCYQKLPINGLEEASHAFLAVSWTLAFTRGCLD
jgi:hypothetical protein